MYERIILKGMFDKMDGGKDWIDLFQDRDRWRAVVNAVMKFQITLMRRISRLAEDLLPSQEGLCSIKLFR
jgi:hypothetical protein